MPTYDDELDQLQQELDQDRFCPRCGLTWNSCGCAEHDMALMDSWDRGKEEDDG